MRTTAVHVPPSARRSIPPDVVLAVAALGVFMEFVDSTIVNVAFPAIHRSFASTTISTLSWVLNAYSIMFAAFLVVSGRLADLFGRRRLFRLGVVVFTGASALCGIAPSPAFLIGMRTLQALGGAMVVPSSMALVIEAYPVARRARATTIYGATAALAAALGPPIGGALIKLWTWRLCFYINVPVGVLVLILSTRLLVESRSPGRRLLPDLTGALLLAAGVGSLTLGIVRGVDWGWSSARTVGTFALCVAVLGAFAWRSSWHRAPIIEPALLRLRPFQTVNGAMLLAGAGFYGYLLCHALFLMLVWDYSALQAGLCFVPGALVAAVTAAGSRRLEARGFAWLVVPGGLLWAAGMAWYVEVVGLRPAFVREWLPGSVITGIGSGLVLPALGAAAIAATPGTGYAMAGALNTTARQIGGALGISAVVVLVGGAPSRDSLRHGWLFAGALFVVVAVVGMLLGRLRPEEEDHAESARVSGPRPVGFEPEPDEAAVVGEPGAAAEPGEENLAAFLSTVSIFDGLSAGKLADIADLVHILRVPAGDYLFRRGDPVDGMYVVRTGRLEVLVPHDDAFLRTDLGRGEVVGELALLAEPRRAATVRAKRDTDLLHISRTDFEQLVLAVPDLGLSLARRLASQMQQPRVDTARLDPLPVTIAVLAAGGDAPALATRLQGLLPRAHLLAGTDEADWATTLDAAERRNRYVLLVGSSASDDGWQRFCAAQADVVLVAADGPPPAQLPLNVKRCTVVAPEGELRGWVRAHATDVDAFVTGEAGLAALGRRLSGRSTGIVLSGGSARALAHVGVLEELDARGVVIDRVAAAGTGALIGAMLASGWSAGQVDAACYDELVRRRPFADYRLTRTSLIRGDRVAEMLARLFGDVWIEELPLPFSCVSTDLVTGQRVTLCHGPLADAVLAAITPPGLMAPVPVDGRLLVDAGGLDNLPIDLLARAEGPIVAVDVAPRDRGPERVERSRARPVESQDGLPTIADALARAMVLGSCAAAEAARRAADVSIVPDTSGVGALEYHQLDALRAAGRDAARAALGD